jgi:3-deoxy-D-manno-octulosonic acid kinase
MQPIDERCATAAGGRILYDGARLRKADTELFDLNSWRARGAIEQVVGGRGSIAVVRTGEERWVVRHYRRGGLIAKLSQDQYVWTGEARTRSFAEWRLLARLRALGLPVPPPIAARYVRTGLFYRADLITQWVEHERTLAQAIKAGITDEATWRAVGTTIADFHRAGVHHADLNTNNILLRAVAPHVVVLDFDRGRMRSAGAWEQHVLARLRRSAEKICAQCNRAFDEREWHWLEAAYRARR